MFPVENASNRWDTRTIMSLRPLITDPATLRRRAEENAAGLPALMAAAEHAAAGVMAGAHTRRRAGAGEKFWQFREYHEHDRPQDIDWRQSAKGERVFIRQKEWQTMQTAFLWVAGGPGMDFSSSRRLPRKSETAQILALSFALLMTRAGERVGLLGGSARPGRSENAMARLGAALLTETPHFPVLPPDLEPDASSRHSALILIGDFLSPPEQIAAAFESLRAFEGSALVLQTLDPAEIELPYDGRAIFRDPAGGPRRIVDNVGSVREAYRHRIENQIADVAALARQHHWSYLLHRTDADIADTLAAAWAAMSPQALETGGAG